MFKLYALLIDALTKIKKIINYIIIRKKQSEKYFTKDALFDIQSFADQWYCSQYIILDGSEPGKIFFSKNSTLDL